MRVMLVALSLVLCVLWSCPALAQSAIHISFEGFEIGKPPPGWVSRNGNIGDVYTVQEEGGKKFLHADARGTAVQIGFEAKWPLKEHPVLEWQWRALILPDKGDEMKKATNDSVLGLYVVFGNSPDSGYQPIHALGVLAIALGIGFLISAILSYVISRRLKLIEPTPDA